MIKAQKLMCCVEFLELREVDFDDVFKFFPS